MTGTARCFYDLLANTAARFPDKTSFRRRTGKGLEGITFSELKERVDALTAGLIDEGIKIGDRVTFLCDASPNWILADLSIISAGGVCVPRGTDVTNDDITYIVSHSGSRYAIVQRERDRKRLKSLSKKISSLKHVYVLEADDGSLASGKGSVSELMKNGRALLLAKPDTMTKRLQAVDPNELATLIYTSGTTGSPKGVMLNQTGWLYAVDKVLERVGFVPEDRAVSLLPPWHAFERANEYGVLQVGLDFAVSDINVLRQDLAEHRPTVFPSVPRIWESIYNGIIAKIKKEPETKQKVFGFFLRVGEIWADQKAVLTGCDPQVQKPLPGVNEARRILALLILIGISPAKFLAGRVFSSIHAAVGGHLRISVSGGSALPGVVDRFFSAIGIKVLEGYGMTETSAVISVRPEDRPTRGTVGTPLSGYEIRIKDDKGNVQSGPGKKGNLWVKSHQILMGYYKRPELNRVVFDDDGFFDTGDIMMLN
ncbi:MAG: AMP-binding protein, partial [Spirochaetia bacterium]|nr:AMP-binding protein [Spirochaetia bacterium]